jgi:predicted Zn finger-like uncharacterized protein
MKIICDSCGTKYSISDDKVRGKVFKIRCKKCSHIIVVRGGESQDDAASAAPAAAATADGGWHIVVEGEQVGPISESEVRARVERGEIRGDTYIWKEGFADWLKLSTVPEFADLAPADSGSVNIGDVFASDGAVAAPSNGSSERSGGRRRSGASKPLFGDDGGGADIFAAPAAAAAPSSGGDLFGSASAHSTASNWPGSNGGGAAMAGHDGGRVENLTGQRHENSVLFSLSNLQSLAMPSAKPTTTALPTTAPTAEGSGLIDIRAMAASTRPAASDGPTTTMDDDLPAFGAFSPAAPVLLPMPSSSGPPWWIYLVIVGMLGLVGGIGFLAYRVISPKQVVVVKEVPVPAPAPEPTKVAAKTPAEDSKKPSTIDEKDLPPRDGQPAKEAKDGKDAKEGKEGRHHGKGGGGSKDAKKASGGGEEKEKKAAGPVAAIAEPPKPAKGSLDDLLAGATKGGGGGGKSSKGSGDDDSKKGGGDSSAGPLSKTALVAGLNSVRPKISACYNQFKVPGTAMVNVVIGKNGKVTKADVTGKFAGTPTGTCVEAAVKTASFPPSDGFSTPYPFQLK